MLTTENKHRTKVVVLCGGFSSEKDVSLATGASIYEALNELGYNTLKLELTHDFIDRIREIKPDIVFNALHGGYGEDGRIAAILDFLQIPYTHSSHLGSAIGMDKVMSKRIFKSLGIKTPNDSVVTREEILSGGYKEIAKEIVQHKHVIKPSNLGSSVGVYIIDPGSNFIFEEKHLPKESDIFIIEEYITGREINVAVLNDKPLGCLEIKLKNGFFDYKAKYTSGSATHIIPVPIDKFYCDTMMEIATKVHKVLKLSGVSRSEFIFDNKKECYLLEINTNPGMTNLSLVPEIAKYVGISFKELVETILMQAKCYVY